MRCFPTASWRRCSPLRRTRPLDCSRTRSRSLARMVSPQMFSPSRLFEQRVYRRRLAVGGFESVSRICPCGLSSLGSSTLRFRRPGRFSLRTGTISVIHHPTMFTSGPSQSVGFCFITMSMSFSLERDRRPNHALQRTRPSRRGCNRTPSWAGSLSLGR